MSTDKPRLVIYTDEEIIRKLDIIAKTQNRSRGNMGETIIRDYIRQYEKENGRINESGVSISKIG